MSTPEQREANRLAHQRWKEKNPERARENWRRAEQNRDQDHRRERVRRVYRERAEQIRQAKDQPCVDCGVQYPYYVMQFDHRGEEPKRFALGRASARSWAACLAEIAKCDVVCANCHAERTHQRRLSLEQVSE